MNEVNPEVMSESQSREQVLQTWLESVIKERPFTIESLPGDASFRRYHRVYFERDGAEHVYIVMDAPPEKESIVEFVQVADLMSSKLNVPDIVARHMDDGFLLLQDFGQVEFAHVLVDADDKSVDGYYQQAMQALNNLQAIAVTEGEKYSLPQYDSEMLTHEMALFTDWFLPYIGVEQDEHAKELWAKFQAQILVNIADQPAVIVHRDFHSRNLMIDRADNERLGVIDFQDAVIGTYSYDLVSLLRDAYVRWDEGQVTKWKRDFWEMLQSELKAGRTFEQFYQDVIVMGLQRHLKVLGIFVRLSERDGKTRYLADIPKVMDDFMFELKWLSDNGEGDIQSVSREFLNWMSANVQANYHVKFAS